MLGVPTSVAVAVIVSMVKTLPGLVASRVEEPQRYAVRLGGTRLGARDCWLSAAGVVGSWQATAANNETIINRFVIGGVLSNLAQQAAGERQQMPTAAVLRRRGRTEVSRSGRHAGGTGGLPMLS
jgi:hypothetical protein